jgi:hypothetical protein
MIAETNLELRTHSASTSLRTGALTAGIGLLLMFLPAMFANFVVIEGMFMADDAAATMNNLLANEQQFRLAVISLLIVIVLDVIVAWGLYVYLKPVNLDLSLLSAWFRLVYTAIFAAAIFSLVNILQLLPSADTMPAMEMDRLQAETMYAFNAFSDGWAFALVLFGIHLIILGYLVYKADYMPKILGILVLIAGAGYVFDSAAGILFPNFSITIGQFTFIGEMLLALWLVFKGARIDQ